MKDGFSCAVSGFVGMEQEILRLRNTNRDNSETTAYLTWRYQSVPGAPTPCVYWLLTAQGERIGMAAAIFRPYWVQGVRTQVAVIGDISLDARWRGRGLGPEVLRHEAQQLLAESAAAPWSAAAGTPPAAWHPGYTSWMRPTTSDPTPAARCS